MARTCSKCQDRSRATTTAIRLFSESRQSNYVRSIGFMCSDSEVLTLRVGLFFISPIWNGLPTQYRPHKVSHISIDLNNLLIEIQFSARSHCIFTRETVFSPVHPKKISATQQQGNRPYHTLPTASNLRFGIVVWADASESNLENSDSPKKSCEVTEKITICNFGRTTIPLPPLYIFQNHLLDRPKKTRAGDHWQIEKWGKSKLTTLHTIKTPSYSVTTFLILFYLLTRET